MIIMGGLHIDISSMRIHADPEIYYLLIFRTHPISLDSDLYFYKFLKKIL